MSSTTLNPNLRGQRISRQELISESQEILQNAGVGNHSRSQFLVEVSREVVGSENPLFCQLQPKIHSHESVSWIRAFSLVFQYLAEHDLQSTLSAIEVEFGQGQLPPELTKRKGESSAQFLQIINYAPQAPRSTTFKERVDQYIEEAEEHDLALEQKDNVNEVPIKSQKVPSNTGSGNSKKTLAPEPYKASPTNINNSTVQQNTLSSQQKVRLAQKKQSPQITPKGEQSKPIITPKEVNKSPINNNNNNNNKPQPARRSIKKKKPASRSSELSDDFVIEEVIPPKTTY